MHAESNVSRRDFLGTVAAGAVLAAAPRILRAQGAVGKTVKIALIGCGGRGSGAVGNCIEAGKAIGVTVKLVAVADAFADKVEGLARAHGLPADRAFSGFDAYRKLLQTDAELVLLATPPAFRPVHAAAVIEAGKQLFMEKPVAVDPPGVRQVIAAGEIARQKGLTIVAGTQRRHTAGYLKNAAAIQAGAVGKLLGGVVQWNGVVPWVRERQPGWSDAEYLARNWVNFTGMSGDHIVEQHVHNLDVANWFLGRPPVTALGFGARVRRETGDQYDFFSVDLDYGDGVHIHSQCRQMAGTYSKVGEYFRGSDGEVYGGGKLTGKEVRIPDIQGHANGQVQEHIDLLNAYLGGKPLNEARQVAEATLTAIMGRLSAYSGQIVRWSDVLENKASPFYAMTCEPGALAFEKGPVTAPPDDEVQLPGAGGKPAKRKKK